MEKHLVTITSFPSKEVKEFYITDETLDFIRKNMLQKGHNAATIPEVKHSVESDGVYMNHLKLKVISLVIDKEKLEERINIDRSRLNAFIAKFDEKVRSMKKYSTEKLSDFINLSQEEVNSLISYRKDWLVFKDRRHFLLLEIKNNEDRIILIDDELNKYKAFLETVNE